jgi:hypothetical protein
MWVEEKTEVVRLGNEVVRHGKGRYVVMQTNKQMTKKLIYTLPILIYQS